MLIVYCLSCRATSRFLDRPERSPTSIVAGEQQMTLVPCPIQLEAQLLCTCRRDCLQQLSPYALQPGQAENEPLAGAALQKLQAALQWEANHQYVNVKASKHRQERVCCFSRLLPNVT